MWTEFGSFEIKEPETAREEFDDRDLLVACVDQLMCDGRNPKRQRVVSHNSSLKYADTNISVNFT